MASGDQSPVSAYSIMEFATADAMTDYQKQMIQNICTPFALSDAQLGKVAELLLEGIDLGLAKETCDTASIKMLPSFVRSLPDGSENGNFLALDLGGTNFRILSVKLDGVDVVVSSKLYRVPQKVMAGSQEEMFDNLAQWLAEYIHKEQLDTKKLPLGFTFSFPLRQLSLTSAKLIKWTKGFNVAGVVGEDIVQLLTSAFKRRKEAINIDVAAVINDTTGTLMACAYKHRNCRIGVNIGTGFNACYVEKVCRIPKLQVVHNESDEMIINTEWGGFGDNRELDFVRTGFDIELDQNSANPGHQTFEKMVSGMYLGELVRLVLEKLTREGLLFGGNGSKALFTKGSLPADIVSDIERDLLQPDPIDSWTQTEDAKWDICVERERQLSFARTRDVFEELGIDALDVSFTDYLATAYVCRAVTTRAAHLTAAGISALLKRVNKEDCTIGVDGSVYRHHPTFKDILLTKIKDLVEPTVKFNIALSEDGSGIGAALVAAVASRPADNLIGSKYICELKILSAAL